jgi:hypothetical protein
VRYRKRRVVREVSQHLFVFFAAFFFFAFFLAMSFPPFLVKGVARAIRLPS